MRRAGDLLLDQHELFRVQGEGATGWAKDAYKVTSACIDFVRRLADREKEKAGAKSAEDAEQGKDLRQLIFVPQVSMDVALLHGMIRCDAG